MADVPATPEVTQQLLEMCISKSQSRTEFWMEWICASGVQRMAEIGVYRGDFATAVLQTCASLTRYYMIDPWRHLDDWNKPANQSDAVFENFFQEVKIKTDFAAAKRIILRGKTVEVIDQIPDGELDFLYVDADHSLRGITIDLIRAYPKLRVGGFIGGDDFSRTIWQHGPSFEPTLVFPFAIYFAEAVGATLYALPHSQFCLHKTEVARFAFVDMTGQYSEVGLRNQFALAEAAKPLLGGRFPRVMRIARRARAWLSR